MLQNNKETALVIFAREPKKGKVKTRLARDLPVHLVLRLYRAFVQDVLNLAQKVQCSQRFIFYAGTGASIPFLRRFARRFHLKRQTGKDLGIRMYNAFVRCQREGFEKVVLIGTDCLTIKPQDIDRAFQKLSQYDCVLGPSRDGGYYLIGIKDPKKAMFDHIPWSTEDVLKKTLKKAKQLRYKTYLLPCKEDIDTISNLKSCRKAIQKSGIMLHTLRILTKINT